MAANIGAAFDSHPVSAIRKLDIVEFLSQNFSQNPNTAEKHLLEFEGRSYRLKEAAARLARRPASA